MAGRAKFTRIPKIPDLLNHGVPTEVIPTYCALADYSNNKTGLCWPKMDTLAQTLNRSVRTIQRHLHLLKEAGVIEFVERRRFKGKFSSYTYKILHIVTTTGHGRRMDKRRSNKRRTKPVPTTPKSPENDRKDGYWWLFGETAPANTDDSTPTETDHKRKANAKRRTDGYEWLFK